MNDKERQNKLFETMGIYIPAGMLDWLIEQGFFMKPAAIKHHSNYTGGLFDHSFKVMQVLVDMTEKFGLEWQNPRSPYVVGMFHDLCKIDAYIDENASDVVIMGSGSPVSKNPKWNYNNECILKGHGDKSVMMLSQFMTLTEEEIMCIRFHMGAYQTEDWDGFDRAIRKYPNVLFTHTADMYASKVME
jgi:hypothetical protein